MSQVKWIKIYTDIFNDEKTMLIESLPEADAIIVIWFKLLCLAGKQNNHGVFLIADRIPYTDEMFATIFRRNINIVRLALRTFEEFGMIEIINGVVTIPNWEKHQQLDKLERKTEYMRTYMQEYRAKQKLLAQNAENSDTGETNCKTNGETNGESNCKTNSEVNEETNCKTNSELTSKANVSPLDKIRLDKNRLDNLCIVQKKLNDTEQIDTESDFVDVESVENSETDIQLRETDSEFERLWELYPRKQNKQAAKTAYAKALRSGVTNAEIEAGIIRYCQYILNNNKDREFIKLGSTWFENRCWEDEYTEEELSGKKSPPPGCDPDRGYWDKNGKWQTTSYSLKQMESFANKFTIPQK